MKKVFASTLLLLATQLGAHCQIPCGIYHDQMVVRQMEEHVETLEKCVREINGNARSSAQDHNQLVRWIMNKESHADKLADAIVEYFLKQRIKPDADKVQEKVSAAHKILVQTMKVKQSVDADSVSKLSRELKMFTDLMYPDHHEH